MYLFTSRNVADSRTFTSSSQRSANRSYKSSARRLTQPPLPPSADSGGRISSLHLDLGTTAAGTHSLHDARHSLHAQPISDVTPLLPRAWRRHLGSRLALVSTNVPPSQTLASECERFLVMASGRECWCADVRHRRRVQQAPGVVVEHVTVWCARCRQLLVVAALPPRWRQVQSAGSLITR